MWWEGLLGSSLVLLKGHVFLLMILYQCFFKPTNSCDPVSHVTTKPLTIAERIDQEDLVIFGNVRSKYPYPNTNDYSAVVDLMCVLKAESRLFERLSKLIVLNISHAGKFMIPYVERSGS